MPSLQRLTEVLPWHILGFLKLFLPVKNREEGGEDRIRCSEGKPANSGSQSGTAFWGKKDQVNGISVRGRIRLEGIRYSEGTGPRLYDQHLLGRKDR